MRRRRGPAAAVVLLLALAIAAAALLLERAPSPAARGAPATATVPAADAPAHPEIGFRSRQRLVEHFGKHGREFGAISREEYLVRAQRLRDRDAGGDVLELRRADGVVTRFDRASGDFLAFDTDLTIRTFFRPNDGEAYFRRQARRSPGGG